VNVGLPSLDPKTYRAITGGDIAPAIEGLDAALDAGLAPVKLNVVLVRGANDGELGLFVELARTRPVEVRFVERMPFSDTNGMVSAADVRERLVEIVGAEALSRPSASPTAEVYTLEGFAGRVGLVSPVTEPFCQRCDRLRVTSAGRLRACLSAPGGRDLRMMLEGGASAGALARELLACFASKPARHLGTFAGPMRGMGG
jgi:cyclic pyranopterin phosphate synthase